MTTRLLRSTFLTLALAAASALLPACYWTIQDPGTDPAPGKLYFPAGVALDPGGRYLYVTNGNADLRFGGGTLQIYDALRFDCARSAAIGETRTDCLAEFPASDAEACTVDPNDPSSLLCDEGPFVLANQTIKLGNFAGGIRVRVTGSDTRQLFIAVRGDPSVTKVNVDLSVLASTPNTPGALVCVDDPSRLRTHPGFNQATGVLKSPLGCDASYLIQSFECMGQVGCPDADMTLPPEPFGMRVGVSLGGARLITTHLASGQLSVTDIDVHPPKVRQISQPFFPEDASKRHGAFGLAAQAPNDPNSLWYLTSNLVPTVATFRLGVDDLVVPALTFTVSGAFSLGNDVRDIEFEPGGARAFITQNNPPSLMVLDTAPRADAALPGQNANRVIDVINVCQQPSSLTMLRPDAAGAIKVYMSCFVAGQLMIVDPYRARVDDTVLISGGPSSVAFNFGALDATGPAPAHRRGFASAYTASRIAMIDFDEASPTRNRVVAQIGRGRK